MKGLHPGPSWLAPSFLCQPTLDQYPSCINLVKSHTLDSLPIRPRGGGDRSEKNEQNIQRIDGTTYLSSAPHRNEVAMPVYDHGCSIRLPNHVLVSHRTHPSLHLFLVRRVHDRLLGHLVGLLPSYCFMSTCI